jgi:four helix bundle protein
MAHGDLEDLVIYRTAERYCDRIYCLVQAWPSFDRQTTGSQLVRAADSIGANIAESYGRYRPNDRAHFLYMARGSAYEATFWIRRAQARGLFDETQGTKTLEAFAALIQSLNAFIRFTKAKAQGAPHTLAESSATYSTPGLDGEPDPF